jgi:TP901 family phage tail tape measure protein
MSAPFATVFEIGFPTARARREAAEIARLLQQIRTAAQNTGRALDAAFRSAAGRRNEGAFARMTADLRQSQAAANALVATMRAMEAATRRAADAEQRRARALAASQRASTPRIPGVVAPDSAVEGTAAGAAALAASRRGTPGLRTPLLGVGAGQLLAGIGLAGAGVGVNESIESFSRFEDTLNKSVGLAGVAREEIDGVRAAIRAVSAETGRSAEEVAEGFYFIRSSGQAGQAALDIMTSSARAAAAGMGDVRTIADTVTSALNAYGVEHLSAAEATDALVAGIREGKAEPAEFAASIGGAISVASQMGVSFQEVVGTIAALSRTGTNASEGVTQLTAVMSDLLNPAESAEKMAARLGTSFAELRRLVDEEGLLVGLQKIVDVTGNDSAAIAELIPNIRALRGVLALLGEQGEITRQVFEKVEQSAGSLNTATEAVAEGTRLALDRAKNEAAEAGLRIGEIAAPAKIAALEALTKVLNVVADALEALPKPASAAIVGVGGVAVQASLIGANLAPVAIALALFKNARAPIAAASTALHGLGAAALVAKGGLVGIGLAVFIAGFMRLAGAIRDARNEANGLGSLRDKAALAEKRTRLTTIDMELAKLGVDPARGPAEGATLTVGPAAARAQARASSEEHARVNQLLSERIRLLQEIRAIEGSPPPVKLPLAVTTDGEDDPRKRTVVTAFTEEEIAASQKVLDRLTQMRIDAERDLSTVALSEAQRRASEITFAYLDALAEAQKIPVPDVRSQAEQQAALAFTTAMRANQLEQERDLLVVRDDLAQALLAENQALVKSRETVGDYVAGLTQIKELRRQIVELQQAGLVNDAEAVALFEANARQILGIQSDVEVALGRIRDLGGEVSQSLLDGLTRALVEPQNAAETLRAMISDIGMQLATGIVKEGIVRPGLSGALDVVSSIPGLPGPVAAFLEGAGARVSGITPGEQAIVEAIHDLGNRLVTGAGEGVVSGLFGSGASGEAGGGSESVVNALVAGSEAQIESVKWLSDVWGSVKDLGGVFRAELGGFGELLGTGLNWIVQGLQSVVSAIITAATADSTAGLLGFAGGGLIRSPTVAKFAEPGTGGEIALPLSSPETSRALRTAIESSGISMGGDAPVLNVQIVNAGEPLEEQGRSVKRSGRRTDMTIFVGQASAEDTNRAGPGFRALQEQTGLRRKVRSV